MCPTFLGRVFAKKKGGRFLLRPPFRKDMWLMLLSDEFEFIKSCQYLFLVSSGRCQKFFSIGYVFLCFIEAFL